MLIRIKPTGRLIVFHLMVLLGLFLLEISKLAAVAMVTVVAFDAVQQLPMPLQSLFDLYYLHLVLLGFLPTNLGTLRVIASYKVREKFFLKPCFPIGTIVFVA